MADYATVLHMASNAPRHPDFADALEAFVTADKACEKARQAFEKAERVVRDREAGLRAVYERLVGVSGTGATEGYVAGSAGKVGGPAPNCDIPATRGSESSP